MKKRSELLSKIAFDSLLVTNDLEMFQNQVLRPILKFQSEHCCKLTIAVCLNLAPDFIDLKSNKREQLVAKVLQGDQPTRSQLIGMILGMMEVDQLEYFIENRKELTMRIHKMLAKRILDQFSLYVPNRKSQED